MSRRKISDAVHELKCALSNEINNAVVARGWTQAQMAQELGISAAVASYVRRGACFEVGTDLLVTMAAALGVKTWVQYPLSPEWVDSAISSSAQMLNRKTFETEAERPLGLEADVYTYPGKSPTELARLLAGEHGWRIYGGALYTADGELLASTLENAAAAMISLRWIRPESGDLGWWREGEDDLGEFRTEMERLMRAAGRPIERIEASWADTDDGPMVGGRGDGVPGVVVFTNEAGLFEARCECCERPIGVTIEYLKPPVFSEHHFLCVRCGECVVLDHDPRALAPGEPGRGIESVYCEGAGVGEDAELGCEDLERIDYLNSKD